MFKIAEESSKDSALAPIRNKKREATDMVPAGNDIQYAAESCRIRTE